MQQWLAFSFFKGLPTCLFVILLWILVFHGVTGIQNVAFSPPRKNDFGVFSALCKSKGFMLQKRSRAA
jgi:hypothetical protein